MTSKISLILNIHDHHQPVPESEAETTIPTLDIEFRVLFRYQLLRPWNISDNMIIVDDVMLPEQRTSLKIPLVFLVPMWRDEYLKHAIETLNLEAGVGDYLGERLAEAADSQLQQRGDSEGFALLVELGIMKSECLSQEETERIDELIYEEFNLKEKACEGF